MKRLFLPAAGVALLVPLASGQVTKTKEGYLLRAKYEAGKTIKFTSQNAVSGPKGQPGAGTKFTMPVTLQVLDVKGGIASVKMTMGGVKMGDTVIRPGQSATVQLNNRNMGAGATGQNLGAQLPSGAIRVGESWSAVAPVNSGMGSGKLNARYTFVGLKTVKGKPVAVLNYSVSGYASGTGSLTILVSDGTLFSNQVKIKLDMGGGSPLVVTSTLARA